MLGYKSVCHDDQSSSDNLDGVFEKIIRIIDSDNDRNAIGDALCQHKLQ